MSTVRESIDVAVPVHIAYERLCHLEDYPQFMQGVQEVTQVSDDMAHWVMEIEGTTTEFNTRITELPDELVAWQSIDGPRMAEKMMFQKIDADHTRVIAELEMEAQAYMPSDAYARETLDRRLKADLKGLKLYIEEGTPTPHALGGPAAPNPGLDDGGILGTATKFKGVTPAHMPHAKPGRGASRNPMRGRLRGSTSSLADELEDF